MLKINPLSTLYVGIDVSSKSNYVCALDFYKNKYINSSFANNQPGAEELALKILECLKEHPDITTIVAALESTSVYSIHIANYLSSCEELMRFKPYVFVLNPKCTANYKKSYIGLGKSDPIDAFVIADFARAGNIESEPWRGSQFLALKRLTRHRLHLVECMTREKTYLVSNLYLKFSQLQMLEGDDQPFCDIYGATSSSVLMEYFSPEEILDSSEEDLIAFLAKKSRNRIKDISKTADLLKKAARDSYRLDKALYEPLNVSIASSFNCIETFKREIKVIDNAIEKEIKGNIVTSPLVGTVYLAPTEDEPPFVSVGDKVKKGQTLAIVDAMKLMNEIESKFDGVVKEVLVDNESPVEFGQEMFVIE